MSVELNHTIVPASDPQVSAHFLADVLGLSVDPPLAHFTPVRLANQVTLDYDRAERFEPHHYAFMVIRDGGITYYADPACREPGRIYESKQVPGRRGTYFRDPDGHLMEILTPGGTEHR
ncbi:VOC family protein [Streptomyces sp. DT225]